MSSRPTRYWLVGLTLWLAACLYACAASTPAVQSPTGKTAVGPAVVLYPSTQVPVYVEDLSLGSRSAPVTLVAFLDLQCPYCSSAWDTIEQLRAKYSDAQLRIVVKHLPLPFHEHAESAAQAVLSVQRQHGDLAAAALIGRVMRTHDNLTAASLREWAEQSTPVVDPNAPGARAFSLTVEEQIRRDQALAIRLGIDGTPSFRINGIGVEGALPAAEFEKLIDIELSQVKLLMAKGVLEGEVYANRVATNHQPVRVESTQAPEQDLTRWAVPVGSSPQLGPTLAPVVVVAFMDYECPFCSRGFSTLKQLRQLYPTQLRIVWKHRPLDFHEQAAGAAEFAVAVRKQKGDTAFWDITDRLFAHQTELSGATYEGLATEMGVDSSAWHQQAKTGILAGVLAADSDEADAFGVEATPQFFVNGLRVKGSRPIEEFQAIVDRELTAAATLKQSGIAEARLGEALVAAAKPAPEPASIDAAARLAEGPSIGPATAKVTIHAFSDYQCPFCQRADATVRELLAKYPKEVRFVWHDLPLEFHEHARAAATLAREVLAQKGNAAFFELNRVLFAKQADLSEQSLMKYASGLDLTEANLRAERREAAHADALARDKKLANELKITSTPTFIVGRYLLEGAQPMRSFERLIRLELAKLSAAKPTQKR